MKTITRLYILQVILIGAIIVILMVLKLNSYKRLNLFLKSSHAYNERMVDNILKMDREVFMRPLHDNSEWDETVQYIKNPTEVFEKECLNTLLTTFSFNHILVFNQQGERVYYISNSDSIIPDMIFQADQIKQLLTPVTPFCHFFININNEPVEFSGATIVPTVDTKHTLPAKGYLFFARNWNTSVIKRFEEITGAKIQVIMRDGEKNQTTAGDSYMVSHNLQDLNHRTVGRMSFTFPAIYFREWEDDTRMYTYLNIFIGLFVIIIIGLLVRKWLVVPMRSLIKALDTGENQHLESLISAKSEFGEMARLIEHSFLLKNELREEINNRLEAEKILSSLKDKAEESDRLKTAFLSNMSHEIRTPMNCILGFIQLLEQEDYTPEERRQYMSMVISSGNQLLAIINAILDISRIENNQMMLQKDHFDLNNLLEKLLISFNIEKQKNGKSNLVIELKKGISGEQSHIYCDRVRLEQILNNLLSNALKFTFSGKITFGYTCEKENLLFFVQDTGVGISAQNQEIIFERFRQEEETHTKSFGGTGLGLPISKGLVELMGGKMWLTSEKGIGSTFYFTLPDIIRHDTMPTDKETAPHTQKVNLSGKTILVVEDVPENIELISTMLKPTHANILRADNGQVAVNLCRDNPSIDLVLMDIQMPVMNGYDATKEIKGRRPELPVIALTAYAFDKDKKRSVEAGCNDFLAKPILKRDLLRKVSDFLGN
jgi:signal transduction histidine kinase/CheY-like chemotaxis protein